MRILVLGYLAGYHLAKGSITLSKKLRRLTNEAKDQHSSFTDLTKWRRLMKKISFLRFSITLSLPQL